MVLSYVYVCLCMCEDLTYTVKMSKEARNFRSPASGVISHYKTFDLCSGNQTKDLWQNNMYSYLEPNFLVSCTKILMSSFKTIRKLHSFIGFSYLRITYKEFGVFMCRAYDELAWAPHLLVLIFIKVIREK